MIGYRYLRSNHIKFHSIVMQKTYFCMLLLSFGYCLKLHRKEVFTYHPLYAR
jgi:hypothetical protein